MYIVRFTASKRFIFIMAKTWKFDGEEQKYLETLFSKKKVNGSMKPSTVQSQHPLFQGFSPAVFRKHWGQTKQMFNTSCKRSNSFIVRIYVYNSSILVTSSRNSLLDVDESSNMSGISEVDGHGSTHEPEEKKTKLDFAEFYNKTLPTATFVQPPVLPCVYNDPDTNVQKCMVVVLLFHGVHSINFDFLESTEGDEPTLKVTYHWPSLMYNVDAMFTKGNEEEMFVSKHHPKVLAVEKTVQQFRQNIEDAPVGHIEIKLPVHVQMDPSTWIKTFNKKSDGTIIVFSNFYASETT